MIDGLDGRAHYVMLASNAELTDLPVGAIVEAARSLIGPPTARSRPFPWTAAIDPSSTLRACVLSQKIAIRKILSTPIFAVSRHCGAQVWLNG